MNMASANSIAIETLAEVDIELRNGIVPSGGSVYLAIKRLADIVISATALIVLAPAFALIALLVKLTSRGPIIFKQDRSGSHGVSFVMYKFRSMRVGAQNDRVFMSSLNIHNGPIFKIPEDPRLTPIGRFLRRSSLDELPQLVNVLLGQMSLVGPRPLWVQEAVQARGAACLRTAVKPGLTCLWQISGRSELSYEEWILLDLFYIRRRSILLDLLVLIQTLPAVLTAHGAY